MKLTIICEHLIPDARHSVRGGSEGHSRRKVEGEVYRIKKGYSIIVRKLYQSPNKYIGMNPCGIPMAPPKYMSCSVTVNDRKRKED